MINYDCSPHFVSGGVVDSYSLQGAPAWLSIDNAGMLTGDADVEAVSNVTVTAHNADGTAVSNVFQVNAIEASVTPVFIAASYDPDTFELKQEVLGVGGETCVHGGILSPDKDGIYHAIPANTPVWKGYRIDETPYKFWRINVIANLSGNYTNIAEIELRLTLGGANQAVGGIATAQSVYVNDPLYGADKAFDASQTTMWSANGNPTQWIQYELPIALAIKEIMLQSPDNKFGWLNNMPSSFEVLASNDGNNWDTISSVADIPDWVTAHEKRTFLMHQAKYYADDGAGVLLDPLPWLAVTGYTDNGATEAPPVIYRWAAANHDDVGKYSLDIDYQGGYMSVLSMGGVDILNVSAGNLILSDGTNAAQLPITEGEHHIEADFSGSNLILDLDGVTDTVPYDGSLGSGDISVGVDIKRLERV